WLLDAMPDLVLLFDSRQRLRWFNRAAEDLFQVARDASRGKTLGDLLPQWLQVPGRQTIADALEDHGQWRGEISSLSPQGREYVHDALFSALSDPPGFVAVLRDITDRKQAIDSFTASQAAQTLNALGHNDALWDWDLRTQELYLSPRWKEMLGYAPHEWADAANPWYALVHPADLPTLRARVQQHLSGSSEVLEADYRALHRNGEYRWMRARGMATRNASGEATRLVGLQSDIQDQKESDELLLFEAFHDATTGLPNRALLLDRIAGQLANHSSGSHPGCVLFADIVNFASVNEALGVREGDRMLAEIARRIAAQLPPDSFLARHGSDEFAAWLPHANSLELEELANRLQFALAKPSENFTPPSPLAVSLGFAPAQAGLSAEDLLFRASQAMAQSRQQGEVAGIYGESNPSAPPVAPPSPAGSQEILTALAAGEFRVFYHPVITLDTGEVAGLEALIRWQHPTRGLLPPSEFLPAAEASGAIVELDRWVLREACAKAAELNLRYRRAETLVLTVNLSSQHFSEADRTLQLEAIISSSEINPRYLRLELSEKNLLLSQASLAVRENLRRLRIQLSLEDISDWAADDNLFRELPIDRVKLQGPLVRELSTGRHRDRVRAIIHLAESRQVQVVGGGVETLEQLATLRELRCHLAQGFYFSRPAPAQDTERLLARSPRW
ncbi:MAG: EAL domain-containing protein, partial [Bryobacter sp.]|nr:EAL domain-containing protein [Bryobacter sp.]